MLLLFAGRDTSDGEYEGVVRAWERLYRDAKGRPAAAVVIVPEGHVQPNAHWRRSFAEVHRKETSPMHVAIVTESAVIRGVITAVNWLVRPRANYCSFGCGTVDSAAERLCSVEGITRDTLGVLFSAAQDAMRERDVAATVHSTVTARNER